MQSSKLVAVTLVVPLLLVAGLSCDGDSSTSPSLVPGATSTAVIPDSSSKGPTATAGAATPAQPRSTQTPSQPSVTPQTTPTSIPSPMPTATASPTTPFFGEPAGAITLVMGQDPPNLNVMDRATLASQLVTDSLGDRLMLLDFSTGRLEPQLAERWEMLGRDRWRLFLRKGVVFHNGEPFDSTAAAWAIDWQTDPQNTSNVGRFLQDTASFVVDALTLDVTCAAACPIVPSRITHAHFQAPAWARNNPTEFARVSISNGPYSLVDWAPGESITLTVFEGYWNPGRTPIMDAMVVWSPDPRARAAMIATEVAQWAYDIDTESRGVVPRWVSGETTSTIAVKLDARFDPLTSRPGVRRAVLEAVDCPGLVRDVLKGLGTCLGVPFQRTATGVGDSFPPFAYDNREARSLIDIEGVAGQQIALYVPDGSPTEARLWEAVAADWRRAGLTVELNKVDPRTHLGLWERGGYPADVTNPA